MSREKLVAGLDIGSSRIRAVLGISSGEGKNSRIHVIGVGVAQSAGLRKGAVIDIEETMHAINNAVDDCERMAGESIKNVYVSIGGSHIQSHPARGIVSIGHQGQEIREDDVQRVLAAAENLSGGQTVNQKVIRTIAKHFIIDGQEGIKDPVGMSGYRLEADAHVITGNENHIKNIERCVLGAGLQVEDFIPSPLAAAESVLNRRQKELGTVSVDIGAGSTNVVVYEEGTPIYTSILPVGGDNITNDTAIGLRTSIDTAERLKIEYGTAQPSEVSKREEIDLSQISRIDTHGVSKHQLSLIISARAQEVFYMVKNELAQVQRDGMLPAGAVLSGASTRMPGISEAAREILGLPVQIGFPQSVDSVIEHIDDPSYATAIGLLLYGARYEPTQTKASKAMSFELPEFVKPLKDMLKNLLP